MAHAQEDRSTTAAIERGRIVDARDGAFKVSSWSRGGVISRYLHPLQPNLETEPFGVGDEVYFFMFPDGRGLILGRIER